MLKLTKINTLSAVALAMAVIATPSLAAANGYQNTAYENCKRSDTENQVLGGVIGAVAGGVLGSQVAGNGARSEGSALGAVIGAVAGSQIANKDCKSRTVYNRDFRSTSSVYGTPVYKSRPVVSTVGHHGHGHAYGKRKKDRGYGYNGYRNNSYGYGGYNQKAALDREIRETRLLLKDLRQRNRYERSRRLDRRIDRVGHRLRELKNQRKYVRDNRGYNSNRGYTSYQRGGSHYHGSDICYSYH